MAKITTRELFDRYFADMPKTTVSRIRPQVDRPEVYAYESQLGKQIVDMNTDELFGLIMSFNNDREFGKKTFGVSFGTIDQIVSIYRAIWNFYIDNVDIIRNPWNDKCMRGAALNARLVENRKPLTFDDVKRAISALYEEYPKGNYNPEYIECLMLLFYNGFADSQEIASFKEEDIDFKTHEVHLERATIKLSDRCFYLLQKIHNMDEILTERGTFKAVSYHGGYFKFIVRLSNIDSFQAKTLMNVGTIITRKLTVCVRDKFDIDITYRNLYLLGFYDFMVARIGKEEADYILTSVRSSEDAQMITNFAKEYGIVAENVTYIKKCLRPFI